MAEQTDEKMRQVADRVLELAGELEAHGDASLGSSATETARATLHRWVDTVVGVVATPAFGRVTLIHDNGGHSTVASSELSFAMSPRVNDRTD